MTLEIFMIGTKGFRAREAAANYKRRERRLVSDEVRAIRFANLHGNADASEVTPVKPVAPVETGTEVKPEDQGAPVGEATETGAETETSEDESGEGSDGDTDGETDGETDGDTDGDAEGDAGTDKPKVKANKAGGAAKAKAKKTK